MSTGLFVVGVGQSAGTSLITMGLLQEAATRVPRVAFLRPITTAASVGASPLVQFARNLLPTQPIAAQAVLTEQEAERLIAAGQLDEILRRVLEAYERLAASADLVVVASSESPRLRVVGEAGLNATLAKNLGIPVLLVVDGSAGAPGAVAAQAGLAERVLADAKATLVATIVNKVPVAQVASVKDALAAQPDAAPRWIVEYSTDFTQPSVGEVAAGTDATVLAGGSHLDRAVSGIIVGAMNDEHVLEHLAAGTLLIVPSDRSDVITAVLAASHAPNAPLPSGILLTGGFELAPAVAGLVDQAPFPVLSVRADTFTAVARAAEVRAEVATSTPERVASALAAWRGGVDSDLLFESLSVHRSDVVTPTRFTYRLAELARPLGARIVLAEGAEPRILRATGIVAKRGLVDLTLLGRPEEVAAVARQEGVDLGGIEVIDPAASDLTEPFAQTYAKLRAHKGVTIEQARDTVQDPSYFGTLMVYEGKASGMVSGAVHTTANTIRPSFEIIKTAPGTSTVSSVFFMCLPDRVLVYGDCAVVPDPTVDQLADIAIASAATARSFGIDPRVALLSYSTGTSGHGGDVDFVRAATEKARSLAPDLPIEGPIQYDAAVNERIAAGKLPDSPVAGHATVLVFPNLNAGNNAYKAVQQSSGALAIGPVLQGLRKPVNDLSRGCTVDDVVNTILITAVQSANTQQA